MNPGKITLACGLVSSLLVSMLVASTTGSLPAGASVGTGGSFVPVTPSRIADTAEASSGFSSDGHFGGGESRTLQVTGRAGVPALTSVSAVVLDVAAASSRDTKVYVDPSDETRRLSALSIHGATTWDSTTVIVRPGPDGKVKVFNEAGATRMNVDVQGYFTKSSTSSTTGGFVPTTPTRVVDSANNKGFTSAVSGGTAKAVQLAGSADIPADATGVFAHVRVLNATGQGGLRFAPYNGSISQSTPSLVNYDSDRPFDGSGVIPVDSNGTAQLLGSTNTTFDVAIDVHGYFTRGTGGGSFHPLTNGRVYDSASSPSGNLAPGEVREIKVGGKASVPDTTDLGSVAMSITALDWTSRGYVSVVNSDLANDNGTSNLAYTGSYADTGTALTSSAIVEVSRGNTVTVRNRSSSSSVRLLINSAGWFDRSQTAQVDEAGPSTLGPNPEVQFADASNQASQQLTFNLPIDASLGREMSGARVVIKSSGTELGYYSGVAVDADGVDVPTILSVNGAQVIQAVTPTASTTFPVTAFPAFKAKDANYGPTAALYPEVAREQGSGLSASQIIENIDAAMAERIADLRDPGAGDETPADPPGTPAYSSNPDEVEDGTDPEAVTTFASKPYIPIPARRNDKSGAPIKPKFYYYNPDAKTRPSWHDYCTNSKDAMEINGYSVNFRGPCGRHDLCIEFKQAPERYYCDDGFKSWLRTNCRHAIDNSKSLTRCYSWVDIYVAAVRRTTEKHGGGWGHDGETWYPAYRWSPW